MRQEGKGKKDKGAESRGAGGVKLLNFQLERNDLIYRRYADLVTCIGIIVNNVAAIMKLNGVSV